MLDILVRGVFILTMDSEIGDLPVWTCMCGATGLSQLPSILKCRAASAREEGRRAIGCEFPFLYMPDKTTPPSGLSPRAGRGSL
jgi:hypothetical protein